MPPPASRETDERDLVAACLRADRAAWEGLVRRYQPTVAARIAQVYRGRLGRPPDADALQEMTQDVFVRLAAGSGRALRAFQWRCALGTYLASIAATAALDRIRFEAREAARWGPRFGLDTAEPAEGDEPDPSRSMMDAETAGRLARAVSALPERERLIVKMRYWGGLSPAAIGRGLGITPQYVNRILRETAERLRRDLER